jgi:hypothetical protein
MAGRPGLLALIWTACAAAFTVRHLIAASPRMLLLTLRQNVSVSFNGTAPLWPRFDDRWLGFNIDSANIYHNQVRSRRAHVGARPPLLPRM